VLRIERRQRVGAPLPALMNDSILVKPAVGLPDPEALEFPFSGPPAPGTLQEVAPGVYWLRMPLPFALDHINLWVLRDGDGWTLVDCGLNTETTRGLWDQHLAWLLPRGTINRVVVTHFHPDHMGLAGWLTQRFGVALWMTEGEFLTAQASYAQLPAFGKEQTLELFRRHGLSGEREEALRQRRHNYRMAISEPPSSFRRMLDGDTLTVDDRGWRIVAGFGHAPEHAALYCEEVGVLISGDMVLPKISTNVSVWASQPDEDPLRLFLSSISRHAQLPADTLVLPSHGLPFRGLRKRTAALHRHHDERLAEVLHACVQPMSAAQIVPVLFRRALDDHQIGFAMGEAIAHLNHLWQQGRLQRDAGSDGVLRFAPRA
jgi:glyoxylase-like metal-dependent hydrolase (beta-lactamase superfamily II)